MLKRKAKKKTKKSPARTSAASRTKKKKRGRPVSTDRTLTNEHKVAFYVSDIVLTALQEIAEAMQRKEGQRVSEHLMAKRIVQSTIMAWMQQINAGELDINDPNWRPC